MGAGGPTCPSTTGSASTWATSITSFPSPATRPSGIYKAIWDEFAEEPFDFLPDKPLTVASYVGGELPTAYAEPVGVGDLLPAMPLSHSESEYVTLPLEGTYNQAWSVFPKFLKDLLGR
jgi:hypothetical protein